MVMLSVENVLRNAVGEGPAPMLPFVIPAGLAGRFSIRRILDHVEIFFA